MKGSYAFNDLKAKENLYTIEVMIEDYDGNIFTLFKDACMETDKRIAQGEFDDNTEVIDFFKGVLGTGAKVCKGDM